jgi:co-chaperonin GroES (HSP10)
MKPNEDRVFLKAIPPEKRTETGIIIPLEAQKVDYWEVTAIGPSSGECKVCKTQREIAENLKPGMIVLINKEAGMDFEYEGEYRVVRFSDIHGYDDMPKKK